MAHRSTFKVRPSVGIRSSARRPWVKAETRGRAEMKRETGIQTQTETKSKMMVKPAKEAKKKAYKSRGTSRKLELLDLPTELLLAIAEASNSVRTINTLSRTNRFLHDTLTPYLYRYSARFRNYKGARCALLWAAENGKLPTAKLALVPYREELRPKKPLFHAAQNGHCHIVKLLLTYPGVDIEFCNQYGETSLVAAVVRGHHRVVKQLLDAGANPNPVKKRPRHIRDPRVPHLYTAVANRDLKIVEMLLATSKFNVNMYYYDLTLLIKAVDNRDTAMMELLFKFGASVEQATTYGESPLIYAARRSCYDAATLLLKHGADVNAVTFPSRQTPLMIAAITWDDKMVRRLLAADDIDVNQVDVQSWSALTYAADAGNLYMLRMLLKHPGIDPCAGDPLVQAKRERRCRVTFLLCCAMALKPFSWVSSLRPRLRPCT